MSVKSWFKQQLGIDEVSKEDAALAKKHIEAERTAIQQAAQRNHCIYCLNQNFSMDAKQQSIYSQTGRCPECQLDIDAGFLK